MTETIADKIANGTPLDLMEKKTVVDSWDGLSPDQRVRYGGDVGLRWMQKTIEQDGKNLGSGLVDKFLKTGKVGSNKVTRLPGESVDECVERAVPLLINEGMEQDEAVAVAHSMCEKCIKAKGPEQFAQWVADQGDKVEAAWMRGMQVFVSMPASEGQEDFEDVIHELQELLGDDYMVDVQTEAEPTEGEGWERVKYNGEDEDEKQKRWTRKEFYRDELTPLGRWMYDWGGDSQEILILKPPSNIGAEPDPNRTVEKFLLSQAKAAWRAKVEAAEDIRDEEPDAPIIRLARGLADIFARQEAEVLAAVVESNKGKKSVRFKINQGDIDRILQIISSFDDEIIDLMGPFAEGMVGLGGDAGIVRLNDQFGRLVEGDPDAPVIAAFDVTNPEVQKFLESYAIQLTDQVQQQSADAINRVLQQSLEEGATTATMAKRIQETGRFSIAQAERIARTESARAYVSGQDESWKQSGVVVGTRWLLAPGACPICQAAAAVFNSTANGVPAGEAALKKGQTLSLPGGGTFTIGFIDLTGPPIHPHDRCDKVAVLTTDAETAKAISKWFDEYAETGKYPAPIKVKLYRFVRKAA